MPEGAGAGAVGAGAAASSSTAAVAPSVASGAGAGAGGAAAAATSSSSGFFSQPALTYNNYSYLGPRNYQPMASYGSMSTSLASTSTPPPVSSSGWMNALGWGTSLVGSMSKLMSSSADADIIRLTGEAQRSVYETNAMIQKLRAEDAIRRGDAKALKAKQAAKRLIGAQRARMGAQGIDIESGSALDIQKETAGLGAMDEFEIKNNAWREAWGYRAAVTNLESQAAFTQLTTDAKARNTVLTGRVEAASTLATTAYNSKRSTEIYDFLSGGK